MKQIILLSILFYTVLSSCNLDKNRKLSDEEIKELAIAHNDSVMVVLDSLYKLSIFIPPLYDKQAFDSSATIKFFELAKATQGEVTLLVNSKLISNEIIEIIKSHASDNSDILFLIDKTGSMIDDIENVKKGLQQIVDAINIFKNVRLGIALYGDKNVDGSNWFSYKDFEEDYSSSKHFINTIEVSDGGDTPESVYDGFFKSAEQGFWKSDSKRMIVLIGDAPPLEKPASDYSISDVIGQATKDKITMNFYPIVVTPTSDLVSSVPATKPYETENLILVFFPNPSVGLINVDFVKSDDYSIEIFNSSGNLVLTENFSGENWKKDLGSFSAGIYVFRVSNQNNKFKTYKFVLQK